MALEIYEASFVKDLFDKMSITYEQVNYITSFGLSEKWRRDCINATNIKKGECVADLMTGMGECWKPISSKIGVTGKIIALDFSHGMLEHAYRRKKKYADLNIEVLNEDVFVNSIPDNSVDVIISGFGIKTFSDDQMIKLAKEIRRILKPNGRFSFVEISVPDNIILKALYMLYLRSVIPIFGWAFLGNPEAYKMLGVYTQNFKNSEKGYCIFKDSGLDASFTRYFFGCATGIAGQKNK